jgi:23S rRNA (adenine2503-C2)-methyltransferase
LSETPLPRLPPLLGRLPAEWETTLSAFGEPKYRARQAFRWIHKRGVFEPAEMSDLSLALRTRLGELGLKKPLEVLDLRRSGDGTRKLLLGLEGGGKVECVLIPMTPLEPDADAAAVVDDETEEDAPAAEAQRVTLCVSTQFGCAMGCRFCASGQAGLGRGLEAHEVVAQVLLSREYLEPGEELKNLVFMGMGEPLHHYDQTERALRLLMHEDGLNISPRRITVSTVGLVPGIRKLGRDFDGKIGLAVSLHAPNDAIRSRIMPMNERYPIADLLAALRDYPLPRRRRLTIEYTLIDGVNDAAAHAAELARLLRGLSVKINLIPMNPIKNSEFRAPPLARVVDFQRILSGEGYSCFVRTRRGDAVDAACGQLAMTDDPIVLRRSRERTS